MGKITTPRYRVEMSSENPNRVHTPGAWQSRRRGQIPGYGEPSADNLTRYIKMFEASTQPGGVNAHLGADTIVYARIVNQETGNVVAEYKGKNYVQRPRLVQLTVISGLAKRDDLATKLCPKCHTPHSVQLTCKEATQLGAKVEA